MRAWNPPLAFTYPKYNKNTILLKMYMVTLGTRWLAGRWLTVPQSELVWGSSYPIVHPSGALMRTSVLSDPPHSCSSFIHSRWHQGCRHVHKLPSSSYETLCLTTPIRHLWQQVGHTLYDSYIQLLSSYLNFKDFRYSYDMCHTIYSAPLFYPRIIIIIAIRYLCIEITA